MVLSLSFVSEMKKEFYDKFSFQIHFHDGCGGQYFTVDETSDTIKEYITTYFNKRNLKVHFSENCESFSVEEA
jgi:hypothetical protein